MCGIAGQIRFDGRRADVGLITDITSEMAERGPDGAGVWSQGPIALGHRRLSIIDLSHHGDQPMVDAELGLTVVFNGCIYNHRDLRRELERAGYRFFSSCDTEVLLKAYHYWRQDFADHLIGMFAACIVERDSGRAVLVRDRLGIKPLYVAEQPGALHFASSLPALLRVPGLDTSVDPEALHHYLTFHAVVPAPLTMLRGVRKVEPGTMVMLEPDGTRKDYSYWNPPRFPSDTRVVADPIDWVDAVEAALRLAVERRLVADVPVGVLLSGGVDSSVIVGMMSEAGQHGLSTFSIGFESIGDEAGDEFRYSDLVARHFGTDHHQIRVSNERVLEVLPDAIHAMNEPMVSHDLVAFYMLSEQVARSHKVVQSGQGADEVFGGYHWYQTLHATDPGADSAEAYAQVFFDRTRAEVAAVVADEHLAPSDVSRDFVARHFAELNGASAAEQAMHLDTHVMLVDDPVKRVDSTTMAHGLEARVPFLDHELVELAFSCPTDLKLAQGGKGVLKEVARRVVPSEVIDRPKGYFPVPPLTYLEGPYVDLMRQALHSDAARSRGLFRPEMMDHLLEHPNELTTLRYNQLWELGLLELWLQSHDIA